MAIQTLKKFNNIWKTHLLNEMQSNHIDDVMSAFEDSPPSPDIMPFNELFGGQWRVVIPFSTVGNTRIRDIAQEALEPHETQELFEFETLLRVLSGFEIDWAHGVARKTEKQINPKTGEAVDRPLVIRIGKLFNIPAIKNAKLNFSRAQAIWNAKSEQIMAAGKTMIIVSQHPIDVLRMSDFSALQSCHSQGGSYFDCSLEEAKSGGPIAYVVSAADFEKVKDRFQTFDEIFRDSERSVDGIVPISRLRIRRIQVRGIDVPMAEQVMYGNKIPGFVDAVTAWTKQSTGYKQAATLKNLKHKDIVKLGGDYEDTSRVTLAKRHVTPDISKNYDEYAIAAMLREKQEKTPGVFFKFNAGHDYFYVQVMFEPIQLPDCFSEYCADELAEHETVFDTTWINDKKYGHIFDISPKISRIYSTLLHTIPLYIRWRLFVGVVDRKLYVRANGYMSDEGQETSDFANINAQITQFADRQRALSELVPKLSC